ncbi:Murein DD-endopeptidase MepM [Candidatus Arsenophonus lipoptenae]|uniref:Murein DD-endopeptidase MepM n=2 Tax=Candidatus Arsenophonus lipoptenae TaxID=634113 RepID=A0A0X9VUA8_9GAMM|nr:Murein DD-endopeptidase MepM [Candidatus Arsenophonus lipoptenae]
MYQMAKIIAQAYSNSPKPHKIMLFTLSVITLAITFWQPIIILSDDQEVKITSQELQIKSNIIIPNKDQIKSDKNKLNSLDSNNSEQLPDEGVINEKGIVSTEAYIISYNDNLTGVLTQYSLDINDIIALSNQYQDLRNLKVGQTLSWELNKDGRLQTLKWIISQRETRIFTRQGKSTKFNEEKQIRRGVWSDVVIQGKINNNFTFSAVNAGLTYNEAHEVSKALQWQIDLRKLKSGDKFSILLSREIIDGHSKQSRLLGVYILTNGKNYYAFRAQNGHYYDSEANSLEQEFLRYPTANIFKVSSPFSLRRINPVTGRISPHQGVDFSMPVGTPILAVGDGEVIVSKYSIAAGNFIAIRHSPQYTTRYMHLCKLLVKPGQKVKKGDRIGLSGNTGRTTGAHLHYELWFNQHAVNPLVANLPYTSRLTGKERQLFLAFVKENKLKLNIN